MSHSTQILLIEDDAAIARGLTDGLLREGYTVAGQATGRAGETFARAHHATCHPGEPPAVTTRFQELVVALRTTRKGAQAVLGITWQPQGAPR
jgi:hypothetical protein